MYGVVTERPLLVWKHWIYDGERRNGKQCPLDDPEREPDEREDPMMLVRCGSAR